jgi:hypothetical protein
MRTLKVSSLKSEYNGMGNLTGGLIYIFRSTTQSTHWSSMKWIKWNEGKEKKEVELTIHKRVEDHFTFKYGVLGINTTSISSGAQYVTLDSKN